MIFVSVGTQLPFPRMMEIVSSWALENSTFEVISQTAEDKDYAGMHCERFLSAEKFSKYVHSASLLISHAGMGNILTALELGKPIIVFGRRVDLGEHRNDHQLATCKKFQQHPLVTVVTDSESFFNAVDMALNWDIVRAGGQDCVRDSSLNDYLIEVVDEWFKV